MSDQEHQRLRTRIDNAQRKFDRADNKFKEKYGDLPLNDPGRALAQAGLDILEAKLALAGATLNEFTAPKGDAKDDAKHKRELAEAKLVVAEAKLVLAGATLNEFTAPEGDAKDDAKHKRKLAEVKLGAVEAKLVLAEATLNEFSAPKGDAKDDAKHKRKLAEAKLVLAEATLNEFTAPEGDAKDDAKHKRDVAELEVRVVEAYYQWIEAQRHNPPNATHIQSAYDKYDDRWKQLRRLRASTPDLRKARKELLEKVQEANSAVQEAQSKVNETDAKAEQKLAEEKLVLAEAKLFEFDKNEEFKASEGRSDEFVKQAASALEKAREQVKEAREQVEKAQGGLEVLNAGLQVTILEEKLQAHPNNVSIKSALEHARDFYAFYQSRFTRVDPTEVIPALNWVSSNNYPSAYLPKLAAFCKAEAEHLDTSIFPTLYSMADRDEFQKYVYSAAEGNAKFLKEVNLQNFSQKTTFDYRQQLSFYLQNEVELNSDGPNQLISIIEHKQFGSLGRGSNADGERSIAPRNLSIIQRHFVPIQLAFVETLQRHFDVGTSDFLSIINASQSTGFNLDRLRETQRQCYDLYSRPSLEGNKIQNANVLPNLMAISDQAGIGKSELLKTAIIAALAMKKNVLVSHAEDHYLYLIFIGPNGESKLTGQSMGSGSKYSKYLSYHKQQIEVALAKFGDKDIIVVTDPLEFTDNHGLLEPGTNPLCFWNDQHKYLASKYSKTMFYSSHSTTHMNAPNQGKNNPIYDPYNFQPGSEDPLSSLTFLGLQPSHVPIHEMLTKLLDHAKARLGSKQKQIADKQEKDDRKKHKGNNRTSGGDQPDVSLDQLRADEEKLMENIKRYGDLIPHVRKYCLPNLRNVCMFLDKFSDHDVEDIQRLRFYQIGTSDLQKHNIKQSIGGAQSLYGSIIVNALINTSITHSYNYLRALSIQYVSPFLQQIGCTTYHSPIIRPIQPETALYNALCRPNTMLRGLLVDKCYDLHLFGVTKDKQQQAQKRSPDNIISGKSITITVIPTEPPTPDKQPVLQHLQDHLPDGEWSWVEDNTMISYKNSRQLGLRTLTGIYWLAKEFINTEQLKSKSGIFVRLPQNATPFDFLFFHGIDESNTCHVSAIQVSVSSEPVIDHFDAAHLYQEIFQTAYNSFPIPPQQNATSKIKQTQTSPNLIKFTFSPLHYHPNDVSPLGGFIEDGWEVHYNGDLRNIFAITEPISTLLLKKQHLRLAEMIEKLDMAMKTLQKSNAGPSQRTLASTLLAHLRYLPNLQATNAVDLYAIESPPYQSGSVFEKINTFIKAIDDGESGEKIKAGKWPTSPQWGVINSDWANKLLAEIKERWGQRPTVFPTHFQI